MYPTLNIRNVCDSEPILQRIAAVNTDSVIKNVELTKGNDSGKSRHKNTNKKYVESAKHDLAN